MSVVGTARQKLVHAAHLGILRAGLVPRRSYAHYWLEDEGVHSRVHLQNFYSTFWPEVHEPATAHVRAFDERGEVVAKRDVVLPPFGAMFLELADLVGGAATQGTVAVDLEPPAAVRRRFVELPSPEAARVNTPFWVSFYDDAENYAYVHSIEVLVDELEGAFRPLRRKLIGEPVAGASWRSWRLLDADRLEDPQLVAINHGSTERSAVVGVHGADDRRLWEQEVRLGARQLRRLRVPDAELARWRDEGGLLLRVAMDPLLTPNGKPYVLLRYAGGPMSLHHG